MSYISTKFIAIKLFETRGTFSSNKSYVLKIEMYAHKKMLAKDSITYISQQFFLILKFHQMSNFSKFKLGITQFYKTYL